MRILTVSVPEKEKLDEKINEGYNDIEIQLNDLIDDEKRRVYYKNIINTDINVFAVHMPIMKNEDLNIEYFTYKPYKEVFIQTCIFAQMLADHYDHDIIVILRNGFQMEHYEKIPFLMNEIISLFDIEINQCPRIFFAIETENGFKDENVKLAEYLNKYCIKKVFGTVLNVCHTITTIREMKKLFSNTDMDISKFTFENYFRINKNTMIIIYLIFKPRKREV